MATTFYQKKNNAKSTITNNPLASGGLSITLASSTGSKFPSTGATWLATIWDDGTHPLNPTADPNMEVVLIDSRSTDTLTVNASGRGYAGTTGVSHATGSAIALLNMKEHMDQYETAINAVEGRGALGYAQTTTAQNGITTETDLTSLSVTVTVPSDGRRVKITGFIPYVVPDTNGATISLYIKESTTQLNRFDIHATTGAGAIQYGMICTWVGTPSAGSHTYKLTLAASAGTVNVSSLSATQIAFILVEYI